MMSAVICSVYENCFCDCVQMTPDTILDTQHMKTQRTESEDQGGGSSAGFSVQRFGAERLREVSLNPHSESIEHLLGPIGRTRGSWTALFLFPSGNNGSVVFAFLLRALHGT